MTVDQFQAQVCLIRKTLRKIKSDECLLLFEKKFFSAEILAVLDSEMLWQKMHFSSGKFDVEKTKMKNLIFFIN